MTKMFTNEAPALEVISPRRRELYFRIIDTYPDIHPITYRLHFLNDHFPPNKLDRALTWLISNQTTGAKFVSWFKVECKNSDLEMHRLLLSAVDNDALKPVVAGRNFKL